MTDLFKPIPFGQAIPVDNPHAVSVSLPCLQDVIDYEEGDQACIKKMKSGYPRFFQNSLVSQLVDYIRSEYLISQDIDVIPISSIQACNIISEIIQRELNFITLEDTVFLKLHKDDPDLLQIKKIIQNAGLIISSRKAESLLFHLGLKKSLFEEERNLLNDSEFQIKEILSKAYNTDQTHLILCNNGANAIFSVCESLFKRGYQGKQGVIQFGWLYLDTMEVISKRAKYSYVHHDVFSLEKFEKWLIENHQNFGIVVSELVTNPKIECIAIDQLYALCKKYNLLLILDTTLISPFQVDVFKYCDIAVESLSKFASGHADILMGAITVKNIELIEDINTFVIPPFKGDLDRMAIEIQGYETRIKRISKNTKKLKQYLLGKKEIVQLLHVETEKSVINYRRLVKNGHVPGLISLVFDKPLQEYYDHLPFPKGPSLGTEFTLVMPYVYLAHYDFINSEKGRIFLEENGLNPNLIRISVGLEPIEHIIEAFEKTFEKVQNNNLAIASDPVIK